MNLASKIAYNTSVQFVGRLISGIINFGVIILLTREFGRATWSEYVTITSYIVMFTLVADFGLNSIFVREVVENPEKRSQFFRTLLSLRLGLGVLAIFGGLAILSFTGHSTTAKLGIIIGIIAIVAQAISYSTNAVFQLLLRYDRAMIADIAGNFFLLVVIATLSISGASVLVVIAVYLSSNLLKAAAGLFLVRNYVSIGLNFDASYGKHLLSLAWPLGLAAIFIQIIANIDKQVVALSSYRAGLGLNPNDAVAIYGLAYRAFDFAIAFPAFVVNSTFPALVEKAKKETSGLYDASKKVFLVLLALGFLSLLGVVIVAPVLIPIFGEYREAIFSLRLLALSLPIFFVSSLGFGLLIVLKKEKLLPFIYGFAALFNFSANYYFVPRFGYNAAALITGLTELIVVLIMAILIFNFFSNKNETH